MQYICKECGEVFEVKPDYCDCGNDTFDTVETETPHQFETIETLEYVKPVDENVEEEPKTVFAEIAVVKPKKNDAKKDFNSAEIISWLIFGVCIILSILVILFFANPEVNTGVNDGVNGGVNGGKLNQENVKENLVKIPSLNSFWDDSLAKSSSFEKKNFNVVKNIENQVKKKVEKSKTTIKNGPVKNNVVNKTQTKSQTAVKTSSKPATNSVTSKQNSYNKVVSESDIAEYKEALRTQIVSKIDFMNILGDGYCEVTFSISSNGTIYYPSSNVFSVLSENSSMNDAVFNAMKSIKIFKPTPTGKNLQSLKLRVSLYGNSFNVYLN